MGKTKILARTLSFVGFRLLDATAAFCGKLAAFIPDARER